MAFFVNRGFFFWLFCDKRLHSSRHLNVFVPFGKKGAPSEDVDRYASFASLPQMNKMMLCVSWLMSNWDGSQNGVLHWFIGRTNAALKYRYTLNVQQQDKTVFPFSPFGRSVFCKCVNIFFFKENCVCAHKQTNDTYQTRYAVHIRLPAAIENKQHILANSWKYVVFVLYKN